MHLLLCPLSTQTGAALLFVFVPLLRVDIIDSVTTTPPHNQHFIHYLGALLNVVHISVVCVCVDDGCLRRSSIISTVRIKLGNIRKRSTNLFATVSDTFYGPSCNLPPSLWHQYHASTSCFAQDLPVPAVKPTYACMARKNEKPNERKLTHKRKKPQKNVETRVVQQKQIFLYNSQKRAAQYKTDTAE